MGESEVIPLHVAALNCSTTPAKLPKQPLASVSTRNSMTWTSAKSLQNFLADFIPQQVEAFRKPSGAVHPLPTVFGGGS